MIQIALRDRTFHRILYKARDRLIINPKDDLSDLFTELASEEKCLAKRSSIRVLRLLIVDALFHGDLKSARQALIKCKTLQPSKRVDSAEASRLLQVFWGHFTSAYQDEIDELIESLGKSIEFAEEFVNNGMVVR